MKSTDKIRIAAALLALSGPAFASHPLVSDDTGTQGTGHWQFEFNTDHTQVADSGTISWDREFNAALTYGATPNLDLAVNLPWGLRSVTGMPDTHGAGDVTVLAKWRFHENQKGWSLALRPEFTLPVGSARDGFGNGRSTAALTLISTLQRGRWTWLANAGMTWNDNKGGDRKLLWAVSTTALYNLNDEWTLAADIGASRAPAMDAGHDAFALVGVIFHASQAVDLDLGWQRSLGSGPTAHTPGAGLTVRW